MMAHSSAQPTYQASTAANWQRLLWREWRNCGDAQYAERVFALLALEPAGWESVLVLALLVALPGLLTGVLIGLLLQNWGMPIGDWHFPWYRISGYAAWGLLAGCVGGALGRVFLGLRCPWPRALLAILHFTLFLLISLGVGAVVGVIAGIVTKSSAGVAIGIAMALVTLPVLGLGVWRAIVGEYDDANLYDHRHWWLWWRGRPSAYEVEATLRKIVARSPETQAAWGPAFKRLEERKQWTGQAQGLISNLRSTDWVERFASRHALAAMGGEAMTQLAISAANRLTAIFPVTIWLLRCIAQDTTRRLATTAPRMICPRCLAHFQQHTARVDFGPSFSYYGCRVCQQSRNTIDGQVVVVLDAGQQEERVQQRGAVRVNWLIARALFDFDQVEIVQAPDTDVEKFVVQVGNDMDHVRQQRNSRATCIIHPKCQLTENTRRMLASMFGRVR